MTGRAKAPRQPRKKKAPAPKPVSQLGELRRRLCHDPQDATLHQQLAAASTSAGDPVGCGRVCALDADPLRRLDWAVALDLAGRRARSAVVYKSLTELATTQPSAVAFRIGCVLRQRRRHGQAVRVFRTVLRRQPLNEQALAELGGSFLDGGKPGNALAPFRQLVTQSPASETGLVGLAESLAATDGVAVAERWLMRALARSLDSPSVHLRLAGIRMPGPNYLSVLDTLHKTLKPKSYIEIGVAGGASMALARSPTIVIGVDPAPTVRRRMPVPARVYRMESDAFFRDHDLTEELGGERFHLAFIDGLHTFDQTLRDFVNLERRSSPGSVIVLHDCLPLDHRTASVPRKTTFWSGDCWRILPCLQVERPDLSVQIIPCAPTGLAIVSSLDPTSEILASRYSELVRTYRTMTVREFLSKQLAKLSFLANTSAALSSAFMNLARLC